MELKNNLSVEELGYEFLSVRSVNVCKAAGLDNLEKIILYFNTYGGFQQLKNCGRKSEKELLNVCEIYGNTQDGDRIEKLSNDVLLKIVSFEPKKIAILNTYFEFLTSKLEVRSQNGLRKLSKELNSQEIFEKIFAFGFRFIDIQNIGTGTIKELDKFKLSISEFIQLLYNADANALNSKYLSLLISTTFDKLTFNFEEIVNTEIIENNKIKVFRLIDYLIKTENIFNENDRKIFFALFTLEEFESSLNSKLDLGQERIRQLSVNLRDNIKTYLSFIANFEIEDVFNYGVNNQNILNVIDEDLCGKINRSESVNFNQGLYGLLFELLNRRTHQMFGYADFLSGDGRKINKTKYKNVYLIEVNVICSFDFSSFFRDIYARKNEKIIKTYAVNFYEYMMGFSKDESTENFEMIATVCEQILLLEFGLELTKDNKLEFPQNTKTPIKDLIFEILESSSEPLTIEQIQNALEEIGYNGNVNTDFIRSILNRNKDEFIYFGFSNNRNGTYGLSKWQLEKDNIKGGSIRELVIEYLSNELEPKHITEILEYILFYRPDTNESSLRTNIKADEAKRFVFYKGNFVGLKNKNYALGTDSLSFSNIPGSAFTREFLKKMNWWHIDDVVNFYVGEYANNEINVKSILQKKIANKELILTSDNRIVVSNVLPEIITNSGNKIEEIQDERLTKILYPLLKSNRILEGVSRCIEFYDGKYSDMLFKDWFRLVSSLHFEILNKDMD